MLYETPELTEEQVVRGKLLSPDTIALLRYEITILENTLFSITFNADPVARENAVLEYVEAQAKRNALTALVAGSDETRQRIIAAQSQQN